MRILVLTDRSGSGVTLKRSRTSMKRFKGWVLVFISNFTEWNRLPVRCSTMFIFSFLVFFFFFSGEIVFTGNCRKSQYNSGQETWTFRPDLLWHRTSKFLNSPPHPSDAASKTTWDETNGERNPIIGSCRETCYSCNCYRFPAFVSLGVFSPIAFTYSPKVTGTLWGRWWTYEEWRFHCPRLAFDFWNLGLSPQNVCEQFPVVPHLTFHCSSPVVKWQNFSPTTKRPSRGLTLLGPSATWQESLPENWSVSSLVWLQYSCQRQ